MLILGEVIPSLFYEDHIYNGYLYALALQLIKDGHHIDSKNLTSEQKRKIMEQLARIHDCGVLHNDIAERNILFEPQSSLFFLLILA